MRRSQRRGRNNRVSQRAGCAASGRPLRGGSAELSFSAICPLCGRRVQTQLVVIDGQQVQVIVDHRRDGASSTGRPAHLFDPRNPTSFGFVPGSFT